MSYRNKGVVILKDDNQDNNDLEKCLLEILKQPFQVNNGDLIDNYSITSASVDSNNNHDIQYTVNLSNIYNKWNVIVLGGMVGHLHHDMGIMMLLVYNAITYYL